MSEEIMERSWAVRWIGFAILLAVIASTAQHSYVLFHSLVEIFRTVVVFGIAALAWNARRQIDHPFVLVAGLAYPSIGLLELLHTLTYKGMGIFVGDANLPTQLWIAFRAYESLVMLGAAGLAVNRRINAGPLAAAFLGAGTVLGWMVLTGRFPDCFVEGSGLTPFKIAAEYAIAGAFAITVLLLWRQRSSYDRDILTLAMLSMICDALAEIAFTHYASVYGMANLIGHLLLLTSTYFLYRALLLQGIQKPQRLLFHHLNREKELLARSEAELAAKVAERTAELTESNRRLQEELAERQRIEQQLQESEEMLRLTRQVALDGVIVIDNAGKVLSWNPAASRMFGYGEDEARGRPVHDLIAPDRYQEAVRQGIDAFSRTGQGPAIGKLLELTARRRDGSEFPVEITISAVQIRGSWHGVGIVRDITDRKLAIRAQEQLAAIVESSQEAIIGKDLDDIITSWNIGAERLYGYRAEEILGQSINLVVPQARQAELAELTARVVRGEIVDLVETERVCKDGRHIDVAITPSAIRDHAGTIIGVSVIAHDISQRKTAERALHRLNRRLKLLSASNHTLLHAETPEELLARMSRAVTEIGNFDGIWIATADEKQGSGFHTLIASPSDVVPALDSAPLPLAVDTPVREALRTGRPVIFAEASAHPALPTAKNGIALPLPNAGAATTCLALWTSHPEFLADEEIPTLEELAADLNFGLNGLTIKNEREEGLRSLTRAMEDTIQAIAATVEMRDPYTAGHQRRVAELSGAIARELGLPEDQVHAIELAAIIHDLGKVNIPAEILTRPGRLSEIEFALIKTHPTIGHEIIKNIRFPWPIADAMLQHHERLDGSGYPGGLKGDAIALEARIIGAADLVEAMSSHRPYRAGLGIDAALEELSRGRGITFDAAVVDASIRLFRERGFQFSRQWGNSR